MSMDWLRLHHDNLTDPKWIVVSRRCGKPRHMIIAVWEAMMICASRSSVRGTLEGWNHEDVGAALDMETEDVAAIYDAMQGKVRDGNRLTGWERRQPKREDDGAAERKRLERLRKQEADNAGHVNGHALSHDVTQCHDREDKSREDNNPPEVPPSGVTPSAGDDDDDEQEHAASSEQAESRKLRRATSLPDDFVVPDDWIEAARHAREKHHLAPIDLALVAEIFVNHWTSAGQRGATKRNWHRAWINWALKERAPRSPLPNSHAPPRRPTAEDEAWAREQRLAAGIGN